MAAGSAEMIFKIRADGSNAEAELRRVERHLHRLGAGRGSAVGQVQRGFTEAASQASSFMSIITGDRLSGVTSQFGAFGAAIGGIPGPAGLAIGSVVALTAAGVALGVGLFSLTKHAADFAGAIFDAQEKTGLSAKTLSTLKFNADNAGASLETVVGSSEKLAKTIGAAADGNEKAQASLKALGVTTYDLDEAMAQAIQTIANAKDGTEQITLAQKAFGKSGADLIPVIKQMGGSLKDAEKEAERLGVTLSDKDTAAADAFGDALGVLGAQAQAAAVVFTSALMPVLTSFFTNSSNWYANNKDEVREWGMVLRDTVNGGIIAFNALQTAGNTMFRVLTLGMADSAQSARMWGVAMKAAVENVIPLVSVFLSLDRLFNKNVGAQIGGSVNIPVSVPNITTGGGGRGGAGRSPKDDSDARARAAEQARRKEIQEAEKLVADQLKLWDAGYKQRIALLDHALKQGEIGEKEHIRDVGRVRWEAIHDEIGLYKKLIGEKATILTSQERKEFEQKVKILEIEKRIAKLKTADDITEKIQKEIEAESKLLAVEKERLETERERERQRRNEIAKRSANSLLDERKRELDRQQQEKNATFSMGTSGFEWDKLLDMKAVRDSNVIVAGIETMRMAFEGLAQAIGSAVQAWVLYGQAGQSVRQVTAQIIAAIAQQAAVKAIFELAEGFAALARGWFGDPKGFIEAKMHFKSAAIYGAVAGVAAAAGRAVAGNSFNEAAGETAGAGGAGEGNSSTRDPNAYTVPFRGMGQNGEGERPFSWMGDFMQRSMMVQAQLEETVHRLEAKITSMPADHVVAIGSAGASREIRDAYHSELGSGAGPTEAFMRNTGLVR